MDTFYKILKLGFDNWPKVIMAWTAIMTLLASLGFNVLSFVEHEPQPPVEIKQEPVHPPLAIIERIVQPAPIKPVLPAYKPRTDAEIEAVCRGFLEQHELSNFH